MQRIELSGVFRRQLQIVFKAVYSLMLCTVIFKYPPDIFHPGYQYYIKHEHGYSQKSLDQVQRNTAVNEFPHPADAGRGQQHKYRYGEHQCHDHRDGDHKVPDGLLAKMFCKPLFKSARFIVLVFIVIHEILQHVGRIRQRPGAFHQRHDKGDDSPHQWYLHPLAGASVFLSFQMYPSVRKPDRDCCTVKAAHHYALHDRLTAYWRRACPLQENLAHIHKKLPYINHRILS